MHGFAGKSLDDMVLTIEDNVPKHLISSLCPFTVDDLPLECTELVGSRLASEKW